MDVSRTDGRFALIVVAILVLAGCTGGSASATPSIESASSRPQSSAVPSTASPATTETAVPSVPPTASPTSEALTVTSAAFEADGPIPAEYTCRGADRSPELDWSGVPAGTTALVLFVDDPDGRDWVHWSVLDLPPSTTGLPAGVKPSDTSILQGTNDFGRVGYGGPCPPSGTHHYRFTLYALAAPLGLTGHPKGGAIRSALASAQVLGSDTLVGTFAR
jgi:Raf kinase inhibitor-like YbhB/YbcL family protein